MGVLLCGLGLSGGEDGERSVSAVFRLRPGGADASPSARAVGVGVVKAVRAARRGAEGAP